MSKTTSTSHSTSSHDQPNENKSNGDANISCSKKGSKFGTAMRYSAMVLAVGAVFVVGGAFVCAPDMSKYEQRSETLYDRAGNIIYSSLSDGDYIRIKTDAHEVDPLYIKMLISSEDERFYIHPGVDPLSAARALISNVSSLKRVSGASTLVLWAMFFSCTVTVLIFHYFCENCHNFRRIFKFFLSF